VLRAFFGASWPGEIQGVCGTDLFSAMRVRSPGEASPPDVFASPVPSAGRFRASPKIRRIIAIAPYLIERSANDG